MGTGGVGSGDRESGKVRDACLGYTLEGFRVRVQEIMVKVIRKLYSR